ncbi:unnamed protein product [Adineta ricciae]|uniref:G-protein coupled receptors family 1 profile domain-containing protein n=1 Tax=Adineta ricciae TaxID=249248 RepID=A0A814KUL3_ADIRI|nr:unnamed protein product [Adineta ricciae]CAF1057106.1 unnamed protein product [Adineta ricciae]
MALTTTATADSLPVNKDFIIARNNLILCRADYFQACWCTVNSTTPISCTYLLRNAASYSNASYFCVYHIIRKTIECINSTHIFPQPTVSNVYNYLTALLFFIGLFGNGVSFVILLSTKLRRLNVYRNLSILCFLNILYLAIVLIRYKNIYGYDLRIISNEFCRFHTFLVAFIGHLCSWQLVSTSIQRVHALFSLESHQTTSWVNTWIIFITCVVIPLFIFDAQLLFNYGLLKNNQTCNEPIDPTIRQIRRAIRYPVFSIHPHLTPHYRSSWMSNFSTLHSKGSTCVAWNTVDTLIYSILPFIITLICSFIIIVKVLQRRRSAMIIGNICYLNQAALFPKDHLSKLLITVNLLFLIMTGPSNIFLMIESTLKCVFSRPISMKHFHTVDEYLRLLQSSYHALSFIFYCLVGNKFRNSAKLLSRTIYYKLFEFSRRHRRTQIPFFPCCFDRRRSSSSGHTTSTASRLSDNKRASTGRRRSSLIPMNVIRRPTYVTFDITHKTIAHSTVTAL